MSEAPIAGGSGGTVLAGEGEPMLRSGCCGDDAAEFGARGGRAAAADAATLVVTLLLGCWPWGCWKLLTVAAAGGSSDGWTIISGEGPPAIVAAGVVATICCRGGGATNPKHWGCSASTAPTAAISSDGKSAICCDATSILRVSRLSSEFIISLNLKFRRGVNIGSNSHLLCALRCAWLSRYPAPPFSPPRSPPCCRPPPPPPP